MKNRKANMKTVNRISFVLDMIANRWKLFALVIVMGSISFCLVDLCIMVVLEQQKTYLQADELLSADKKNVYRMSDANVASILNFEEEIKFEQEIVKCDFWHSISTFSVQRLNAFEELKENTVYQQLMEKEYAGTIQQDMIYYEGGVASDTMWVCAVNQNAKQLFDIQIPEAVQPQNAKNSCVPIYAGDSFRGILELGQVLSPAYLGLMSENDSDEIEAISFYVAGFLENDACILSDSYIGGASIASNLNTMILMYEEDVKKSGYYFDTNSLVNNLYVVLSEKQLVSFRNEVSQLYEQYGKKLELTSLTELIKDNNTMDKSLTVMIMMAILLTLSGFLAFVTTSIIAVLLNKRQFGIMLANGVSHRDLNVMLIMETSMKYVIALIVAFCIMHVFYLGSTTYQYTGIDYKMTYWHLHLCYVLPFLVLMGIIGVVLSSIVPQQIVKRMNMMELLRENC